MFKCNLGNLKKPKPKCTLSHRAIAHGHLGLKLQRKCFLFLIKKQHHHVKKHYAQKCTKAERNFPIILVINKIDRSDARISEVLDEVYDLFIDLDANDEQIDFPVIYTNAKEGISHNKLNSDSKNLEPLFDKVFVKESKRLSLDELRGRIVQIA